MSGDQPDMPGGGDIEGQGKDGEFEGRTYLYIRTNPADTGAEPLAAGLQFWTSPDIWIVKPGGAVGGQAVPNQVNQVQVTVTNAGGIPAIDALVDAFVADPSLVITPTTATLIGSGYLDVPAYSAATASFPWTPTASDAGHRCIVARVSLVLPPDTYLNPLAFEVVQDRHVAQRNIQVLEVAQGKMLIFPFMLGGADPAMLRVTERTRDVGIEEVVALAGRIGGLPARHPLASLKVQLADAAELDAQAYKAREMDVQQVDVKAGDARELRKGHGRPFDRETGIARGHLEDSHTAAFDRDRIERGAPARSKHMGALTFQAHENNEPGYLHVVDVTQVDEQGTVVGGLTFIVKVV